MLEAFLDSPASELSGADVQKGSDLASKTLYPILLRLEAAGGFVSRWDTIYPVLAGRPRRRLYRLTANGLARASEAFARFEEPQHERTPGQSAGRGDERFPHVCLN